MAVKIIVKLDAAEYFYDMNNGGFADVRVNGLKNLEHEIPSFFYSIDKITFIKYLRDFNVDMSFRDAWTIAEHFMENNKESFGRFYNPA